jgi:hypothetical protein
MGVLSSVPGSNRGQLRVKLNRESVLAAKVLISHIGDKKNATAQ